MLVIGLTGGIGCGKSAVSDLFSELGVPVIDADLVARELVAPGQPTLARIAEHFGQDLVQADGSLDRSRLRTLVFADEQARKALEAILHPLIRQRMRQRLRRSNAPYAIMAIPLLLETGQQSDVDRVLVVDCPEQVQLARVRRRDGLSVSQANEIFAAQLRREERLDAADDLIDNGGSLGALRAQVEKLHRHYLALSAKS